VRSGDRRGNAASPMPGASAGMTDENIELSEGATPVEEWKREQRQPRSQIVRIGTREIESHGAPGGFWSDLYHRSMTTYWPVFFGTAALIFIVLNTIFAFLFWLGDNPIANVAPDLPLPLSLFYFSIETLATVGYGDMHPQTNYGHLIATVEIFTGMSLLAVMTGLVFARFSRPRPRFVFSEHPVVTTHQGQPTLMLRVANARNNTISQATSRLWLFRMEYTAEGYLLRRYHELKLERQEHPMFALSWTLFHRIDEKSPLFGKSIDDLNKEDAALALNISGIDDSSAQNLHARKLYAHDAIRWNHRFRDITSTSPQGRLVIDYSKFHDVEPEDA
jgi:inward rectifier potassium channel